MSRPQVKASLVTVGSVLIPDDLFTCLEPFKPIGVDQVGGKLIIRCKHGCHYLDGQLDFESQAHYVGFELKCI